MEPVLGQGGSEIQNFLGVKAPPNWYSPCALPGLCCCVGLLPNVQGCAAEGTEDWLLSAVL